MHGFCGLCKLQNLPVTCTVLDARLQVNRAVKKTKTNKEKIFMAPFYRLGSTASRLEPLQGGSLLFTTKFPETPGTHFIDLGRMKG